MSGIDDIEIFPEIPKDLTGNFIIDFPVNLELNDNILWMPPDALRKNLNGGITGLLILPRNIWDNALHSKSGSKAEIKNVYNSIKDAPKYPKGFESVYKKKVLILKTRNS